jgi:hypothetical protein
MKKIDINIWQILLTGLFTVTTAFFAFYFNSRLDQQQYLYNKNLVILQDSLKNINDQKLMEINNINALFLDVEITEIMYFLLKEIDASHVHLIKVHNGGKELSPIRPKYNTILTEATNKGVRSIKHNYQSRIINSSNTNVYTKAITNKYYVVNDYKDEVFKADNEEIIRLKALDISSFIICYIMTDDNNLVFLQISFNKSVKIDEKIINTSLDKSHLIKNILNKWKK